MPKNLPANRKRDFLSESANKIPSALLATPSIELKKKMGARKKNPNHTLKKKNPIQKKKKQTKTDTFQKPLESLSGNWNAL